MSPRDGLIYGMSDVAYHDGPELSSTGARHLLDSPARYHWEATHRRATRAFDVGHAVHAAVLGTGPVVVAYPGEHLTPSGNPSTKAATVAWEAEQREAGLVPLAISDHRRVTGMVEAVLAHSLARATFEDAPQREVSLFATIDGVRVRARYDALGPEYGVDLKTTAGSASPAGFGREAAAHGYPVQDAWYTDALDAVTGDRLPMRFVVVEKAPPHLVAVHEFDELVRQSARGLATEARRLYRECTTADYWPGHGDDLIYTEMPAWWWHRVEADDMEMTL